MPHSLSVWKHKVDQEIELNHSNVQKSNSIPNQIIISFNKSSSDGILLIDNKMIMKCVSIPTHDVNTQDLNNHKFCFELQFVSNTTIFNNSILSFTWDDPMI